MAERHHTQKKAKDKKTKTKTKTKKKQTKKNKTKNNKNKKQICIENIHVRSASVQHSVYMGSVVQACGISILRDKFFSFITAPTPPHNPDIGETCLICLGGVSMQTPNTRLDKLHKFWRANAPVCAVSSEHAQFVGAQARLSHDVAHM